MYDCVLENHWHIRRFEALALVLFAYIYIRNLTSRANDSSPRSILAETYHQGRELCTSVIRALFLRCRSQDEMDSRVDGEKCVT